MTESPKKQIRIEYVEDGLANLELIGGMFEQGLKRKGVVFEGRSDFSQLNMELEGLRPDDLPDVLILDHEAPGGKGADLAIKAKNKARELGKELIVINLLCSAPWVVKNEFGSALENERIPVLNKLSDAAMLGFYLGECIGKDGKLKNIELNDWLKTEGLTMRENETSETRAVNNSILTAITCAESGGFFMKPRLFIDKHKPEITRFMTPEAIGELNFLYPPFAKKCER